MNILILTGQFGMGHYSAAESLKQDILVQNPDMQVNVVDIIEYMVPRFSKAIYGGFNFMVSKCSWLYNFLNQVSARYSRAPFERTFIRKLENLLGKFQPELIISTLPLCSQYISAYKSMRKCNITLYTYVTDITAHEEWISQNTSMYFVGSESTKNTLISKGVAPEKIIISGIPVKRAFKECSVNKRNEYGDPVKEILIMGGGLGLIPSTDKMLKQLSQNASVHVTMITGKNEKLLGKIKKEFPNIEAIGYTDKVCEYMKRADVVVTKSGGITTFEAINCETPLYVIKPFLSQEVGNAEYIQSLNIGRVLWSNNINIAGDLLSLIENQKLLNKMQENMREVKSRLNPSSPLSFYYSEENNLCL